MTRHDMIVHKGWLFFLATSLLFLAVSGPIAQAIQDQTKVAFANATAQRERLTLRLHQWRDDAQTAQTIRETISSDEIETLLAPTPREAMTARLEPLAATARLVNVTFALSAAQKWEGGDAFPSIEGTVISTLSFEADAPHDGDIFAFLDSLSTLPGKFTIKELSITPLRPDKPDQIGPLNLHMKTVIEWIANAPPETAAP